MKIILISMIIFVSCFSSFSENLSMRNPFRKPNAFGLKDKEMQKKEIEKGKELSLENLQLTGIINGNIALINHRFVKVGDKLGVFKVNSINENIVQLTTDGKTYQLILKLSKLKNEK